MKRAIVVLLIIGVIGAGAGAYYIRRGGTDIQVNTSLLTRGDIVDAVGATGTLQAVTTVQVGSQVSGNIQWLGADFNSIVKKDQVIARVDPSLFQAAVEQSRANLIRSRADHVKANADGERNKVALVDATQKYTRAKELAARSLLSQSDLDAAKIAVDSAQAALQSSQAAAQSAQAQVAQAQATLNQNQVNLDHCTISAPIDGIVTSRNVDVGQTVAASFQSPTLFIIAADLTKMQVNANIDEADVGRIRPGQHVTFKVDAYPTEDFRGTVSQIRLQPIVVQNVTTYGTVIDVPNPELKLKPGMTANVKVEIARRTDVLRVPNTALRFRPNADMFAAFNQPVPPDLQSGSRDGRGGMGQGRGTGQGTGGGAAAGQGVSGQRAQGAMPDAGAGAPAANMQQGPSVGGDRKKKPAASKGAQAAQTIDALFAPLPAVESSGRVWLYVDKQLKPVRLRLGITDGTNTELLSGELQPNTEVVTGITGIGTSTRTNPTGTGNPLMGPQRGPMGGGAPRGR